MILLVVELIDIQYPKDRLNLKENKSNKIILVFKEKSILPRMPAVAKRLESIGLIAHE